MTWTVVDTLYEIRTPTGRVAITDDPETAQEHSEAGCRVTAETVGVE